MYDTTRFYEGDPDGDLYCLGCGAHAGRGSESSPVRPWGEHALVKGEPCPVDVLERLTWEVQRVSVDGHVLGYYDGWWQGIEAAAEGATAFVCGPGRIVPLAVRDTNEPSGWTDGARIHALRAVVPLSDLDGGDGVLDAAQAEFARIVEAHNAPLLAAREKERGEREAVAARDKLLAEATAAAVELQRQRRDLKAAAFARKVREGRAQYADLGDDNPFVSFGEDLRASRSPKP